MSSVTRRPRGWFQFSLRTFLLLMLLVAFIMAYLAPKIIQESKRESAIARLYSRREQVRRSMTNETELKLLGTNRLTRRYAKQRGIHVLSICDRDPDTGDEHNESRKPEACHERWFRPDSIVAFTIV